MKRYIKKLKRPKLRGMKWNKRIGKPGWLFKKIRRSAAAFIQRRRQQKNFGRRHFTSTIGSSRMNSFRRCMTGPIRCGPREPSSG